MPRTQSPLQLDEATAENHRRASRRCLSRVAAHHADCCIVNLFALRCLLIGQAPTRAVESVACRCGAQLEPAALLMRCWCCARRCRSGSHCTPLLGQPPHAAAATADASFIGAAAIISWMHTIAMTCA
ncbi:hypothetical protein Dimus_037229, partial [Dionaea muscipula]